MKLKQLESMLQDVAVFRDPKVELEQYPTGAHLASRLLYTAATSFDDVESKLVVDLGCGTGMLSIGAALLGAGHVLGIDADEDALCIAQENLDEYEGMPVDLVCARVEHTASVVSADTVITNPPFGTRSKGADMEFLRAAFRISRHSVYSLHKTSTRKYIAKYAVNVLGALSAEPVAQLGRGDKGIPLSNTFGMGFGICQCDTKIQAASSDARTTALVAALASAESLPAANALLKASAVVGFDANMQMQSKKYSGVLVVV
eukprot:jgi/Picre1/29719/NNA_005102.t1